MKIAISKASGTAPYRNYIPWLQAADDDVEYCDLIDLPLDAALAELASCSGLVLTGGPDVDPARFNRSEERGRALKVDEQRDELEFRLLAKALEMNIPVLGICRGLQLINIARGGSLVMDIPTDVQTEIEHRQLEGVDAGHHVVVQPGTLLKKITGELEGEVNSAHHQAIENIGEGLVEAAESSDGLVEAIELAEPANGGFLLAVQWHPERMAPENPFSQQLAAHFIFEAYSYNLLMKQGD